MAAQTITPEGVKRLVAGSAKRGAYHAVNTPDDPQTVLIAEGLATALTCHLICPDALTVAGMPGVSAFLGAAAELGVEYSHIADMYGSRLPIQNTQAGDLINRLFEFHTQHAVNQRISPQFLASHIPGLKGKIDT